MSEDKKCVVCENATKYKCSNCCTVYYCSKEHQKKHWKKHKLDCQPFIVKEDKCLGRHLVATKDIKEGEIIYKEKPLIIGPEQITPPVCLGCNKLLNASNCSPCERCGWPVCSLSCQESPHHRPECDLTSARGQKMNVHTFGSVHPSYHCLTVVRCLYMKKSNPEVWDALNQLESHCDQRKLTQRWKDDNIYVVQFAKNFFKLQNYFTDEEIMKICGVVQVNGHEVPFSDPPYLAIYNKCSMFEHSCRANCAKSFTEDGEILIAAAMDIKAGQNLSICYTDPMWSAQSRLSHLNETKFFECKCERCSDVTDLGTMFNAIKCQKDNCAGYALPKSFGVNSKNGDEGYFPSWYCNTCSNVLNGETAQKLITHVGRDLDAMKKGDADSCLRFLQHYAKYLHHSHFYMMDVTLALAQLLGQENGLEGLTDERLAMKIDLCRKMSEFLEKIAPAEVRARGMLLYELHAAIAETGRRRAATTGEGPSALIYHLTDARQYLEKSIRLLKNESPDSTEGKTAKQAIENIAEMDAVLQNLYSTLDSPM